jgi:hypothetical protein
MSRLFSGILFIGQIIDLFGGLYLAYDIFGGAKGPLRKITRALTYVFAAMLVTVSGYVLLYFAISDTNSRLFDFVGHQAAFGGAIGLGIGSGLGGGIGYTINQHIQQRFHKRSPLRRGWLGLFCGAECGLFGVMGYALLHVEHGFHATFNTALIAAFIFSFINGYIFAALVATLLIRRIAPEEQRQKPTPDQIGFRAGLLGGFILGFISGLGYVLFFSPNPMSSLFAILAGSIVASVGLGLFARNIQTFEWRIEQIPERRLGIFGFTLILIGFSIGSLQYLIPLLGIPIH